MYLFKTEVPDGTAAEIHENIELRLDENVPLPPSEAVFYFDIIRDLLSEGKHTASVSVAPRKFVESYLSVLEAADLLPLSFEVVPKSLARAIIPSTNTDTKLIIHLMENKAGFYIVDEGVVLFTSTVGWEGDQRLAEAIKAANPSIRVCFVGPPVTTDPDRALNECSALDFICRREFDFSVVEYAQGKPLSEIVQEARGGKS